MTEQDLSTRRAELLAAQKQLEIDEAKAAIPIFNAMLSDSDKTMLEALTVQIEQQLSLLPASISVETQNIRNGKNGISLIISAIEREKAKLTSIIASETISS